MPDIRFPPPTAEYYAREIVRVRALIDEARALVASEGGVEAAEGDAPAVDARLARWIAHLQTRLEGLEEYLKRARMDRS